MGDEPERSDSSGPPEFGELAHEEAVPPRAVPADPPVPNSVLPTERLGTAPQWPWAITTSADEQETVVNQPLPDEPEPVVAAPFATRIDPRATGIGGIQRAPIPERFDPRRPRRPQRSRRLLPILGGAAAVVVLVIAGVLVFNRHSGGPSVPDAFATVKAQQTARSAATATPKATSSATQLQATERKAATALASLLAQNVIQLRPVPGAITDVRGCGPKLRTDSEVFFNAGGDRRRLLSELASLAGRSALPAALLRDLTDAWQSSAQEDTDLGRWADDVVFHHCTKTSVTFDANLRASNGLGSQAAEDQKAFVKLWDPIAQEYDLASYRYSQL